MLIINADDFGRSRLATDNIIASFKQGGITSASVMVFMRDSRRSIELAAECGMEVGLHLNFTQMLDQDFADRQLLSHHKQIIRYLTSKKSNFFLYNHFLRKAFDYVYKAQVDEYERIFGMAPTHFNGHHHMHLCANMLVQAVIPKGQVVRRHFTYFFREKSFFNRSYRSFIDSILKRRYFITDLFISLSEQLRIGLLMKYLKLANGLNIELQTHPESLVESEWLKSSARIPELCCLKKGNFVLLKMLTDKNISGRI